MYQYHHGQRYLSIFVPVDLTINKTSKKIKVKTKDTAQRIAHKIFRVNHHLYPKLHKQYIKKQPKSWDIQDQFLQFIEDNESESD